MVGRHAYIISDTGGVAYVFPFTLDYASIQLCIVDVVVQYNYPYNLESYILVISNMLYVPSTSNNLLLPLVLREAGIKLNDTPKI